MALVPELYTNITALDVRLARIYLPLLLEVARQKGAITYGGLVEAAQRRHPGNPDIKRAIPVSTGRRLEVIRLYCKQRELPDLAALVVNKETRECGAFYASHTDPQLERNQVYALDWDRQSADLDDFIDVAERLVTPRRRRSVEVAKEMMSRYFRENRSALPGDITSQRELLLELLGDGFSAEEAFAQACEELRRLAA